MGILLEYIVGRPASISNFEGCLEVLRRLHERKVLLNDSNRFNFLVDNEQIIWICDSPHARENAKSIHSVALAAI